MFRFKATDSRLAKAAAGLALLLALSPSIAQQQPDRARADASASLREAVLAVRVNGDELSPGAVVLRDANGQFFLSVADVESWRLATPEAPPLLVDGAAFWPLEAFAFTEVKFDDAGGVLDLRAKAEAFAPSTVRILDHAYLTPTRSSPGAYLNYDLSALHSAQETQQTGLFQLGAFGPLGTLSAGLFASRTSSSSQLVRLDTTFTADFPNQVSSLRVGDIVTAPGAWGSATRLGGIQYGTDFNVRPALVTTPLQSLVGEAVLPSSVDVLVNNVLTAQREVPAGPFAINDLPVVNGNGQIAMVVRDLAGRQQVITQSFASSLHLLRKGLAAHSFELGAVRENYAQRSNDYGAPLASGTYRYGVTNALTAEAHLEATSGLVVAGSAFAWQTRGGVLLGTAAFSDSKPGVEGSRDQANGSLLGLGFERAGGVLSVGGHAEVRDRNFQSLATEFDAGRSRPHVTADLFLNRSLGRWGSAGAAYVWRNDFDGSKVGIANLNHSVNLGPAFLGLSYQHVNARSGSRQINAFLTLPLGGRHSASLSHRSGSGASGRQAETIASVQRNAPAGEGVGYMLQAASGGTARAQALYQAKAASFAVEAERVDGHSNSRLSAQGGLGLVGGKPFVSRPVLDSFALVRAPDAPNTRVYANNQEIGRTNERGELIIPGLRPYEENVLRLEQLDLGLDVAFQSLQVNATPYRRSGVVVQFPVTRNRAVTLRIVRENGDALPVAARLMVGEASTPSPIGQDGLAYLTGLGEENEVRAQWPGHECRFSFRYPQTDDALPDLGVMVCEETL